jgi:hypothetical protein
MLFVKMLTHGADYSDCRFLQALVPAVVLV